MRSQSGSAPTVLFLIPLLSIPLGCGPEDSSEADRNTPVPGAMWVHPDSLAPWTPPAGVAMATPVAYRLEDLGIGPDRFEPLRARYLQTVYDAPNQIGSRVPATIHVDRAVQSGPWDGTYPAQIPGLREPGLIVDWQIQNPIYNAFDRVLTDQYLGTRQRVMPGGSSVAGLVMGAVRDGVHWRLVADPTALADGPGGTGEEIVRTPLPGSTVNVLTTPLVLSQMELAVGDAFTLPGYALIGGPNGTGTEWLGVYEVLSVREDTISGASRRVMEILSGRRPIGWSELTDLRTLEGRVTRIVVSNEPPYLLAREDYVIDAAGTFLPLREHLHLVDWAPLPMPGADLVPDSLWRIQLDSELFNLEPSRLPAVMDPSR